MNLSYRFAMLLILKDSGRNMQMGDSMSLLVVLMKNLDLKVQGYLDTYHKYTSDLNVLDTKDTISKKIHFKAKQMANH